MKIAASELTTTEPMIVSEQKFQSVASHLLQSLLFGEKQMQDDLLRIMLLPGPLDQAVLKEWIARSVAGETPLLIMNPTTANLTSDGCASLVTNNAIKKWP